MATVKDGVASSDAAGATGELPALTAQSTQPGVILGTAASESACATTLHGSVSSWTSQPTLKADISSGARFEFTQDEFDLLSSDLSQFSVSRAVAASSAFPVLLTPIVLKNYSANARQPEAEWIHSILDAPDASMWVIGVVVMLDVPIWQKAFIQGSKTSALEVALACVPGLAVVGWLAVVALSSDERMDKVIAQEVEPQPKARSSMFFRIKRTGPYPYVQIVQVS